MNEVIEMMKTRRSIRKFKPDALPDEIIEQIAEAGTYAATGKNLQSPTIIAVTNKQLRDRISEMNRKIGGWQEGFDPFYGAPAMLIVLADKNVREKDFDVDGFLNVLEPYYKNGEYGYLLNSDKELDLLNKRFIVFELDVVKDNPVLFPVVTIIIMETFINKMRRLQGIRKMILIEEA